jgi:hypothetical protein
MALDIAMVDDDDRPLNSITIRPQEHSALMKAASRLGLACLSRMDDYYGEANIAAKEVLALRDECETLLRDPRLDRTVVEVVMALRTLCDRADHDHQRIAAIPD